jgi:hypothetical protein
VAAYESPHLPGRCNFNLKISFVCNAIINLAMKKVVYQIEVCFGEKNAGIAGWDALHVVTEDIWFGKCCQFV